MKKIFITILLLFNLVVYWRDGRLKIDSGLSAIGQNAQQVAGYLNSLNNGYIYTYNSSANLVFQHNGSGGWPSVVPLGSVSIPSTWYGSPTGSGFTGWLGTLSSTFSSAITNFLGSIGSSGSGESSGEEYEFGEMGWEPMPDGFGYDPTDPNSVDNLMNDPNFNPGLIDFMDTWTYDNIDILEDLYNGNYTIDCQGIVNGTAYLDNCGDCVGGTTGLTPCVQDCAGVWGGANYLDSCNVCVDSSRKQPCDSSYKTVGDSLYNYLYKPEFADSLNKLMNGLDTASTERAMSLGTDSATGAYKATGISYPGTATTALPIYRYPNIMVFKLIHTHPNFGYACFSGLDFYGLSPFYNHSLYNRINSQYVIAYDSSVYAMAIDDSALYSNFIATYPHATYIDSNNSFDPLTPIGQEYENVYKKLAASMGMGGTLSDNEAHEYAQAYVMSKFNTGLVLYRKRSTENKFTKINTSVSKDAAGNNIYSAYDCL